MQQSWAGVADGNAGFGKTGMRQCRVRYVPYMFAHWHPSRMRKLRPLRPTRWPRGTAEDLDCSAKRAIARWQLQQHLRLRCTDRDKAILR